MRKVMNKHDVAHAWANQTQDSARTTGNGTLYFEKDTIFSYGSHFPIAKHFNGVVLFTERGYSNSTAKHIAVVRQANWKEAVYCILRDNMEQTIRDTFNRWLDEAECAIKALKNARKPEKYTNELESILQKTKRFCEVVGVDVPVLITQACAVVEKDSDYFEKRKVWLAEQAKIDRKKALAQDRERIKKFEKGELSYFTSKSGESYLRVGVGGEFIETSQRVSVGVDDAHKLYRVVNMVLAGKEMPQDLMIDQYRVLSIDKKYVTISCHKIPMKNISKIAKKLNW